MNLCIYSYKQYLIIQNRSYFLATHCNIILKKQFLSMLFVASCHAGDLKAELWRQVYV